MKFIIPFTMMALLISCAKTTIFPNGGDAYSSVSTSSNQGYAEDDAKNKAEAHCRKLGKHFAVIKHDTQYHGADKQTQIVGGVVSGLIGGPNFAVSDNDYEVKMQFKCV